MAYPGGKGGSGVVQRLINFMPPHSVYLEPFLGGGAVLKSKRPAALNIGIDRNSAVVDGWRGIVDQLRDGWRRRSLDPVVQASGAVPIAGHAENGGAAGGIAVRGGARGSAGNVRNGGVRSRDRGGPAVEFHCADALKFLASYRYTGGELVYADPPYVHSTRSGRMLYGEFEMSDLQHKRLLRLLLRLPCAVMVSGYHSELYAVALKGWHTFSFNSMTRAGRPAREHVWCNFAPPVELHDYSWLGENFRERERISRMRKRWIARLGRMPRLQRLALQSAIASAEGATRS